MFISFINLEFVKFLYDPLMSSKYVKTLQAEPWNDIHCILTNPTNYHKKITFDIHVCVIQEQC